MKMNTIEKCLLFYTLVQCSVARTCKQLKPTGVETLNVKVFYSFENKKWNASKHLIDTVCRNAPLFGNQMTVEFVLVSYVMTVDSDPPMCLPPYHCKDELTEICTERLSGDPTAYVCCADGYQGCLDRFNISSDEIQTCVNQGYNSPAGWQMVNNNNKEQNAVVWVGALPALVFNTQNYDECTDNAAYDDFVGTCCKLYKPECAPKPPC